VSHFASAVSPGDHLVLIIVPFAWAGGFVSSMRVLMDGFPFLILIVPLSDPSRQTAGNSLPSRFG
jgi:hypothetical protein